MIALADAGARNRTPYERVARYIDFMSDSFVDDDTGYELEKLRRYQNGEKVSK